MNLLDLIYTFFIGPLELFFEVIFSLAYSAVGNPGIAIIVLSLAMNFLVLPLYRRADALQEEERDRMAAMKPWTDHIKKTFTGDERFMMLQTYNRQMGYKPTDVFKGSISLLLEIPFFIAAYHFLSHLQLLHGVSFGPLADLGAPDALIHIGGISINFLPILMTLINVISAAVYLKGFPLSSKIQTYGIAAIFLVLLYNSPSGLVFYWTLNNLFSLVKNLVYRVSAKQKVTRAQAAQGKRGELLGRAAQAERGNQVAQLEQPTQSKRSASKRGLLARLNPTEATTQDNRSFVLGGIFFALLIGVFIPLTVIQSSPEEFVDLTHFESPLFFVAKSFALALGTFVLWFGVFYRLASPKGRSVFGFLLFAAAATAIVNFLFFGTDYGTLSAYLQYYTTPKNDALQIGINIAVAVAIAILLFVVWQKKRGVARVVYVSLSIALLVMAGINIASINDELEVTKQNISQTTLTEEPRIKLSKTG
ncbi:MAG: YidC/Oxa1 family membrane protein insertase, partial [Eggerthellaceae bacterium]|nr:YidC/Oxa1 family membrane protein insertase [Eggerthellaceae bacterium]